MTFELPLTPRRNDQISHLRRQEASQPAHALDFAHLVGDALFTERRSLSITATIPQHIASGAGGVEFLA